MELEGMPAPDLSWLPITVITIANQDRSGAGMSCHWVDSLGLGVELAVPVPVAGGTSVVDGASSWNGGSSCHGPIALAATTTSSTTKPTATIWVTDCSRSRRGAPPACCSSGGVDGSGGTAVITSGR